VHLARLCATTGVDRFSDPASWDRLASGEPYFTAANTWIRGAIVGRMRAGESTVIALHALEAHLPEPVSHAASPLVYHNRSWHGLGEHSRVAG
jgi:flavin reductase (DIM6/NTAB) family NADH-FMN oxidoreductase RutF